MNFDSVTLVSKKLKAIYTSYQIIILAYIVLGTDALFCVASNALMAEVDGAVKRMRW